MVLRQWPAIWLSLTSILGWSYAQSQIPSPNLDLKALGRVAVGGDFDAISLYSYEGQREGVPGNGTQAILRQLPNGMYDVLAATDANIEDMCTFVRRDGSLIGVVIGGNFTSVGGVGAQSVAFIDGKTGEIRPHVGIQGNVNALFCDDITETVYVGGAFDVADSSNAIAWLATGSWANLPFAGFDAPVTSITRAPDGHIIFGGSFTGLSNMSTSRIDADGEVINLNAAAVTSVANVTSGTNIVCPSNDSASIWTLEDNTAGSWTASMRYGFEPSKLRLWNNQDGNGVRTWRYTALPNTGIMNFTYTDPATGEDAYCDARCPLAQNSSLRYQDFYFVNRVGMNSFRLDVSDWYGEAGALKGVELFQNDTFVYAIEAFNEPSCLAATSSLSRATATGPWYETPSRNSVADYLAVVVGPTTLDTTNIVFEPSVQARGNYTVVVYTPGCKQDSSCSARGSVNVTCSLTAVGNETFTVQLSQQNDYEKYDQVYAGPIDPASDGFRPAVTITPSGQLQAQLVVASRVRFSGNPSTGGLNGLFDYDPNTIVTDTDFSKSAINNAGTMLKANAQVNALAVHADTIYAAGSFSDDTFENIMSFSNNQAQGLPNGGLNAAVADIYSSDDFLYVGGNFTGTNDGGPTGLENIAAFNYAANAWVALGAGVNGPVIDVVPFQLNMSSNEPETVIGFSGSFSNILSTADDPDHAVDGFAVWVPSRSNWLQNLDFDQFLTGMLCANTSYPNGTWLGAGTLTSLGQAISGIAGLDRSENSINIQRLPVSIESSTTEASLAVSKRALLTQQNITGVVTGTYDMVDDRNITVLGGHFSARTNASTIQNLVFIDGGNDDEVTGLPTGIDDNSTFTALTIESGILFAGGMISGLVDDDRVQGIVLYDMANRVWRVPQPAALEGDEVIVNSIAAQPGSSNVFVGGSFESTAQGLACSSVCVYDTSSNIWSSAGGGVTGVVTALHFSGNNRLVAAGNLSISGNETYLAEYDTKAQSWSAYETTQLPGPVTALAPTADNDQFWVAGTSTGNNSAYLVKVDGKTLVPVVDLLDGETTILGLQMMQLTQGHASSDYLDNNKALLIIGQLNITGFGRASAALFNGTDIVPFILSVDSAGQPGSVSTFFSSQTNPAMQGSRFRHSLGIAILVAFCAALGTIFLVILAGMILNRIQRKRAGYSTIPNAPHQDKNMNINRVPPERLFASMGQRTTGAPAV